MKIFISHQKRDAEQARQVADYLTRCGIEVYFDEYDRDLHVAITLDDPKRVVNAIKKGVKASTHMLCLISPNTLSSKWVPFEIGYGYDETDVMALTLKGIRDSDLPDYIKAVPVIRDIYDLDLLLEKIGEGRLVVANSASTKSATLHPLHNVMDKFAQK